MVNACRLLSNEPLLPVPSARLLAEQSASELKAKVEGTHAIGYYYSAGTGPKQAAATRAKTASKMPLPPQAPKVLNTSAPRKGKKATPVFCVRRPEGDFWDLRDGWRSEKPLYRNETIELWGGESVVAS